MRYGSVCSGIEAASVAWHSLGWEAQWYSEIEHFPSEVLKYRFPNVPNLGDMTQLNQFQQFNEQPIDLLVGGTPCQSFSVAGLRKGLADPRGNLMLTFLSIADKRRPKWILWENVPGVLSSNGGKDFGTFLGALGELGYGFAYRVLDAQHFGVAQRRRRVFVVGYLGDWRPAGAVLFESESLQRDSKQSRAKRQETATDAQGSVRATSDVSFAGGNVSPCVTSKWKTGYGGPSGSNETGNMVYEQVAQPVTYGIRNDVTPKVLKEKSGTLQTRTNMCTTQPIAYSFDSLASNSMKSSNPDSGCREVQTSKTLDTTVPEPSKNQGGIAIAQPISIAENTIGRQPMNGGNGDGFTEDGPMYTLNATGVHGVAQPIAAHKVSPTITAKMQGMSGWAPYNETEHLVPVAQPIAVDWRTTQVDIEKTGTLKTDLARMSGPCIAELAQKSVGALCARDYKGVGNQYVDEGKVIASLVAKGPHAVAGFLPTQGSKAQGIGYAEEQAPTLRAGCDNYGVMHTMAIRRLTPKECERLQGFPDDWTKIPYRNKPADQCPDGPRYKACGNSMAVPVMRWIGERIQMIENYLNPNL